MVRNFKKQEHLRNIKRVILKTESLKKLFSHSADIIYIYIYIYIYTGSAKSPTPPHVSRKWVGIKKNGDTRMEWMRGGLILIINFLPWGGMGGAGGGQL